MIHALVRVVGVTMPNAEANGDHSFDEFIAELEPSLRDAEIHLKLPAGSIADIRNDSDYLAIVKMHAAIEPLLNSTIEKSITRAMRHPKVAFPGADAVAEFIVKGYFNDKVRLALAAELITDGQAKFIRAVQKLRNHYAHNLGHMSQTIWQAAEALNEKDGGFSLQRDLIAASDTIKNNATGRIVLALMRPMLFVRFASLLASLMTGIRPPPPFRNFLAEYAQQHPNEDAPPAETGEA